MRAFLLPFASYFRNMGWTVDAASAGISSFDECVEAFDKVWEMQWSRTPLDFNNFFNAPKSIREIVRQEGYEIVHVHTPIAAFMTRWALRKERRNNKLKVIYTAHGFHFIKGTPFYKNLLFIILEKLAGNWTDYLVVINKDDQEAALKYRIVKETNLVYIPGIGIDSAYYNPNIISEDDLHEVRNEIGLDENDKYFLMVGEFNNNKCQTEAVKALYKLNKPGINLVFAGDGSTMVAVKDLSEYLGVWEKVYFLGHRNDIPRLIKGSIALLLTSRREGLPRCILEAMSLEVPIIATNIRGTRELLADGAGIFYQVGNIGELRNAMQYIIDNPEVAQEMGKAGRKQVLDQYELGKIIQMHEELYVRALGYYSKPMVGEGRACTRL
ncbi:glycosyltransferase [Syntrophomonas curvata]